jgi:hypothetical protein
VLIRVYALASHVLQFGVSGYVVRFVEQNRSMSTAVLWLGSQLIVRSVRREATVKDQMMRVVTRQRPCMPVSARCRTEGFRTVSGKMWREGRNTAMWGPSVPKTG